MANTHIRVATYFGSIVMALYHETEEPYPWVFTVREPNGTLHRYGGIPNRCATAASALRRGWWRAKWMADGSYAGRYATVSRY
jgi:hypothetical protein